MIKPGKHVLAGLAVATLSVAGLSACGSLDESSGGGSSDVEAGSVDPTALKGVTVKVGSKEFDEQLVLGQLTLAMMKAAGADAVDETNTKGSTQAREKLIRGGSDVYWDYNGTGWINYLGHDKPILDSTKQTEATAKEDLAKNNLVWGPAAPFNNTYAFAVTEDFAKKTGVKTDSDMAAYIAKNPKSTVCVESEFAARPDGYPGFKKAYGITGGSLKSLGTGVVYTQTAKGACDFGEVFTTDGRIGNLKLQVLDDDKTFFPLYNGVLVERADFVKEHPEVQEVMKPLAEKLTTEVMQDLNTKVSAEGLPPAQVAQDFLKKEGFIK
ncbi:glycine/betaine ABC transporter substrate-binding protein [Marmoricola endophyticus]|uniref:Glycine/betaine ABC transporter substrate-binding protein n=1 Tax=Marmoricola endophyticus TaxID=2040280 RepID=A0A917BJF0_9ACTN|nr:glycine betaine ABC transporter substrate-binding protein [Marmoricola endophyticus]GGF44774.1 glycine/betaine ABC transporter substrate-binding protein [Marmoricola endophyticus]